MVCPIITVSCGMGEWTAYFEMKMYFPLFLSLSNATEWFRRAEDKPKQNSITSNNNNNIYIYDGNKTLKNCRINYVLKSFIFFSELALTGCGILQFHMEFLNTFSSWTPGSVCSFRWSYKGNVNPGSLKQETDLVLWQILTGLTGSRHSSSICVYVAT